MKIFFGTILCALAFVSGPAKADTTWVFVQTSDNVTGAGTDSNVYITLLGTKGQTRRLRLQDLMSGDILEKGDVDFFIVNDDIGTAVTKILLESQGDYAGSDWHLERIVTYTFDPKNPTAAAMVAVIGPTLAAHATIPSAVAANGIVSTFSYADWITGEETYSDAASQTPRDGVELTRAEPAATPDGSPKLEETNIFVVYYADALDSAKSVPLSWKQTVTRSDSLTLSEESSNRAQVGLEANYGYTPPDTGGQHYDITLSAEYEYIRGNTKEQTFGTERTSETADEVAAEPGTLEFRILTTTGRVTQQSYQSTLSGKSFAAYYIADADLFRPRGVTFEKGVLADDRWDRSVARPVAASLGCLAYDSLVKRLKKFGSLNKPLSCKDAMTAPL